MKKYISIIVLMMLLITNIFAQQWLTNFDEAKKVAATEQKNILMVFSGSDWCVPCMKLEKNIWKSEEFKTRGQEHFVLLRVDFPRKKDNQLTPEQQKHNEMLAEKYNQSGYFPMIDVVNSEGKVIGNTGFKNIKADKFIDLLISMEKTEK